MPTTPIAGYFSPWTAERQPCWHCRSFDGLVYQATAALCAAPGGSRVRSMPADGCSGFEREPGADDEPGPPMVDMPGG